MSPLTIPCHSPRTLYWQVDSSLFGGSGPSVNINDLHLTHRHRNHFSFATNFSSVGSHSLSGLHVRGGPPADQRQRPWVPAAFFNVYQIHSLGKLLRDRMSPILFHAIIGVVIVAGGANPVLPLQSSFSTRCSWTGMIAFACSSSYVFHMHGWFHSEVWRTDVVRTFWRRKFEPYNATSSAASALQDAVVTFSMRSAFLSCVTTWRTAFEPPALPGAPRRPREARRRIFRFGVRHSVRHRRASGHGAMADAAKHWKMPAMSKIACTSIARGSGRVVAQRRKAAPLDCGYRQLGCPQSEQSENKNEKWVRITLVFYDSRRDAETQRKHSTTKTRRAPTKKNCNAGEVFLCSSSWSIDLFESSRSTRKYSAVTARVVAKQHVLGVGGGLAGLAASMKLAELGVAVEVLSLTPVTVRAAFASPGRRRLRQRPHTAARRQRVAPPGQHRLRR